MLLQPWDFPGKCTGVGCHFLLQGIFPTQGSNPGLPHCRQTLYHLSHQEVLSSKESACNAGDEGDSDWIPESGRSPGEGNGNPLQCSCLKNSTDRGAWQDTVHGVMSQTQLSNSTTTVLSYTNLDSHLFWFTLLSVCWQNLPRAKETFWVYIHLASKPMYFISLLLAATCQQETIFHPGQAVHTN